MTDLHKKEGGSNSTEPLITNDKRVNDGTVKTKSQYWVNFLKALYMELKET